MDNEEQINKIRDEENHEHNREHRDNVLDVSKQKYQYMM